MSPIWAGGPIGAGQARRTPFAPGSPGMPGVSTPEAQQRYLHPPIFDAATGEQIGGYGRVPGGGPMPGPGDGGGNRMMQGGGGGGGGRMAPPRPRKTIMGGIAGPSFGGLNEQYLRNNYTFAPGTDPEQYANDIRDGGGWVNRDGSGGGTAATPKPETPQRYNPTTGNMEPDLPGRLHGGGVGTNQVVRTNENMRHEAFVPLNGSPMVMLDGKAKDNALLKVTSAQPGQGAIMRAKTPGVVLSHDTLQRLGQLRADGVTPTGDGAVLENAKGKGFSSGYMRPGNARMLEQRGPAVPKYFGDEHGQIDMAATLASDPLPLLGRTHAPAMVPPKDADGYVLNAHRPGLRYVADPLSGTPWGTPMDKLTGRPGALPTDRSQVSGPIAAGMAALAPQVAAVNQLDPAMWQAHQALALEDARTGYQGMKAGVGTMMAGIQGFNNDPMGGGPAPMGFMPPEVPSSQFPVPGSPSPSRPLFNPAQFGMAGQGPGQMFTPGQMQRAAMDLRRQGSTSAGRADLGKWLMNQEPAPDTTVTAQDVPGTSYVLPMVGGRLVGGGPMLKNGAQPMIPDDELMAEAYRVDTPEEMRALMAKTKNVKVLMEARKRLDAMHTKAEPTEDVYWDTANRKTVKLPRGYAPPEGTGLALMQPSQGGAATPAPAKPNVAGQIARLLPKPAK